MNYVSLITTVFGSFVGSYLVTDLLYTITNNTELWIIFFVLLTFYIMLAISVYNYLYKENHAKDLWFQSRQSLLLFLQVTLLMTVIRLVVDSLVYAISVTPMLPTDYINLFNISLFFIFVLLFKLQSFLTSNHGKVKSS